MADDGNTADNETIYGFGKTNADFLLSMISGSGTTRLSPRHPGRFRILQAKTSGSGIAAASSATVYYREPTSSSWADTVQEYTAYNIHPTVAVGASRIVLLAPVNGRWVVIWEACP